MTENKNIQVRNYILSLLESGVVDGECKLPSALELAGRLNISLLTVQNALATLANEGVLKIIPRQGTFVDQNWKERILQTNIGFYVPCSSLPWSAFFADRIRSQFPQLHISSEMRNAVFEIRPTLHVQMNHKQYLDLAPLFESCFPDRSCFFEAPLNAFYYGKQLVGLPFLFSPRVMFVNTVLLRKAECPMPDDDWQWDDFLTCIRILRRHYPGSAIFAWNTSYHLWMNIVLRAGGGLIDPASADPVQIDSEKTRLGLRLFRDLRHELFAAEVHNSPEPFAFEHGKLAFMVDARQAVGRLQRTGMKDWTVVPLPHIPDGRDVSMQATELLCVRRECVSLDTVEQLVRFLLSEEFQNHLADLEYSVPIRRSSAFRSLSSATPGNALFLRETESMCSQYHLDSAELAGLVIRGISGLLSSEDDIDTATAELAGLVRSYFNIHKRIVQYGASPEFMGKLA